MEQRLPDLIEELTECFPCFLLQCSTWILWTTERFYVEEQQECTLLLMYRFLVKSKTLRRDLETIMARYPIYPNVNYDDQNVKNWPILYASGSGIHIEIAVDHWVGVVETII